MSGTQHTQNKTNASAAIQEFSWIASTKHTQSKRGDPRVQLDSKRKQTFNTHAKRSRAARAGASESGVMAKGEGRGIGATARERERENRVTESRPESHAVQTCDQEEKG